MDPFIDEVVRRSIRHARLMLKQGAYDWPVARRALRKILADLELRCAETIQACRDFARLSLRTIAPGCERILIE